MILLLKSKTRALDLVDNLPQYLKAVKDVPFKWGEHDCLTFTNNAWKEMHGYGWADDWLDRYMDGVRPLGKEKLQKTYGFRTFVEAVDSRLRRVDHIPPRGSLVSKKVNRRWCVGNSLGIAVGNRAAFLSQSGVVYVPIESIDMAWVAK